MQLINIQNLKSIIQEKYVFIFITMKISCCWYHPSAVCNVEIDEAVTLIVLKYSNIRGGGGGGRNMGILRRICSQPLMLIAYLFKGLRKFLLSC